MAEIQAWKDPELNSDDNPAGIIPLDDDTLGTMHGGAFTKTDNCSGPHLCLATNGAPFC